MRQFWTILLPLILSACIGKNIDGISTQKLELAKQAAILREIGYRYYPIAAAPKIRTAVPNLLTQMELRMVTGYEKGPYVFKARQTIRNQEIDDIQRGAVSALLSLGYRPSATEDRVEFDVSVIVAPIILDGNRVIQVSARIQRSGHLVGGGTTNAKTGVPSEFFNALSEVSGISPLEQSNTK